jgi:prepilin-type N-terminal cleavage/methylation domain-containing protein
MHAGPTNAEGPLPTAAPPRRAFTLIELLVVISVIALLVGILLPALGKARSRSRAVTCATRLQQLGIGLTMYFGDYDNTLPQVRVDVGGGYMANIGALFGGKKGTLQAFGIDTYGPERRPLNRYVFDADVPPDSENIPFEMEAFRSPSDRGGEIPGVGHVDSMYDELGSSYTLNDHSLAGEDRVTLIPTAGGKMPYILTPTKTWMLGSYPIYNFQENGDRDNRWYNEKTVEANLLFADMHVGATLHIETGVVNTTDRYTFLPRPNWPQ